MNKYSTSLEEARSEIRALRRELEIEAALEKIRTRTMAMQKSDELTEVSYLLNKQVVELGIPTRGCAFHIYNEHDSTEWFSNLEGTLPTYNTPRENIFLKYYEAGQRGETLWIEEFGGERIKEHYEYLCSLTVPDKGDETVDKVNAAIPEFQIEHVAYFKYGYLLFITLEPAPEAHEVFKRFAKAFEQTYTRFLDLQKAEAQTREALIEAALERVRAKVQAMRSSDDLIEVANVLRDEMGRLGQPELESFIVHLYKHESSGWDWEAWWAYRSPDDPSGEILNGHAIVPVSACEYTRETIEKYSSPATEYLIESSGKKLLDWYRVLERIAPQTVEYHEQGHIMLPEVLYYHHCKFSGGSLLMISNKKPTQESCQLQRRAAAVFDLAYQRFLDLQKAEAQAREAQIEAALERVRSRSMAMHHTAELQDVIKTVHDQLSSLHIDISGGVFIAINEDTKREISCWGAGHTADYLELVHIPFLNRPIYTDFLKVVQQGPGLYTQAYSYEEKIELFQHLLSIPPYSQASADHKKEVLARQGGYIRSVVVSKHASIFMINHNGRVFTSEEDHILLRFSNVFEQSYTRFLDLQKAEVQAREAQIEVALERVRARTMAMRLSSDLHEVIKVVMEQLLGLGLRFNVTNFARIHSDGSWDLWLFTPDQPYPAQLYVPYLDHPIFNRVLENIQAGVDFSSDVYDKGEKDVFFRHFFEKTLAKNTPEERKNFVYSTKGFARSLFLTQDIWFAVVVYDCTPFTDEENAVLRRFAGVFEQSYTRFLDLQKAEAQAREAQIEAALEKVRSRSLAMHQAEELGEVATVVFEKLRELDMPVNDGVAIVTHIEGSKDQVEWMENPGMPSAMKFFQPYYEHPILDDYWNAKNEGLDFIAPKYTAGQSRSFFNHIFENTDYKNTPQDIKDYCLAAETYSYFAAFQKNSSIFINDYSGRTLTDQEIDIVKRFSKVFEQAYVRFLDLQKAEAQAREAEIQLALERVRARTMAMQKSDELREVVGELFHQVQSLGIEIQMFVIFIFKPDGGMEWWGTEFSDKGLPQSYFIPSLEEFTDHSRARNLIEIRRNKTPYQVFELSGKEKENWDQFLLEETGLEQLPAYMKEGMRSLDKIVLCDSVCEHGILEVAGQVALSGEHENILQRFSKVFEQTYTRFLDVKKAEIQAREAQIEAALERVRSRSMAMHKSEELHAVNKVVLEQLRALGIDLFAFGIHICRENEPVSEAWMGDPLEGPMPQVVFNHANDALSKIMYTGWKKREELIEHQIESENLKEHFEYMMTIVPNRSMFENVTPPERLVYHFAYFKHGFFVFVTLMPARESHTIFQRFAKVFEQTYTRFLDLQKAEAQAREAQIEASLERVRARAMAMHKSEELSDAAMLLYTELRSLGISQYMSCGYVVIDEEEKTQYGFMSTFEGNELDKFTLPLMGEPAFDDRYENWKKQVPAFHQSLGGTHLRNHLQFASPHFGSEQVDEMTRAQFKDPTIFYCFNFSSGYLHIISDTLLSPENEALAVRFTKVLELTYKRFLDLQKAEAQAREAEIQLALERVRARTMAMLQSSELSEVVKVFYEQISPIGIAKFGCTLMIFNEREQFIENWFSGHMQSTLPECYYWRGQENPVIRKMWSHWKNQDPIFTIHLKDEEKYDFDLYLQSKTDYANLPDVVKKGMISEPVIYFTCASMRYGLIHADDTEPIPEKSKMVLMRFANVFEQTHTRFLDLQKAEAQAREAQIEAALERVRSRTMAMHKSVELEDTVTLMLDELTRLEMGVIASWISFINVLDNSLDLLVTHGDAAGIRKHFKGEDYESFQQDIDVWKQKKPYLKKSIPAQVAIPLLKESFQINLIKSTGLETDYHLLQVRHKYGYIGAGSWTEAAEENIRILQRLAAVFEQTYTRFLDLQKAEAQAREAQIEAALERVRAKAMAMHSSRDLVDTISVFYHQMVSLSTMPIRCGIGIADKETQSAELSTMNTTEQQNSIEVIGNLHMLGHPVLEEIFEHWLTQTEYHPVLRDKEIDKYYDLMRTEVAFPRYPNDSIQFGHFFYFSEGWVYAWTNAELNEDELRIYRRFTSVLSLTYKRFKDLKQAEAQAREAQIEAALERVRAKTMAMQKSDELPEAANLLFQQVQSLGMPTWSAGYCIWDEDKKAVTLSMSRPWGDKQPPFRVPLDVNPSFIRYLEAHSKGLELYIEENSGKALEETYQYLLTLPIVGEQLKSIIAEGHPLPTYEVEHCAYFSKGFLLFITYQQVPEAHDIFKRFASVFDQTYTRFLDLQKAEAQAREAQIEAALERVRAQTMAMHNSEDVGKCIVRMFAELTALGVDEGTRFGIGILNHDNENIQLWTASKNGEEVNLHIGNLVMTWHPLLKSARKAWKEQVPLHQYVLEGEDLVNYYQMINNAPDYKFRVALEKLPAREFHYGFVFDHGFFYAFSHREFQPELIRITQRFSSVFGQTYRRYLDLVKAEAQAHEAQIEAALERVRAKAMAMHSSQDLADTIGTFYTQLKLFNLVPRRCGVGLLNKHNKEGEVFTWNTTENGESLELVGKIRMDSHPVLENVYNSWITQTEYHPVLRGNEIREYYKVIRPQVAFPEYQNDEVHYGYFFMFEEGGVYAWKETPLQEDELAIYRRFTSVLSLTYKRYKDLKDAEARAKEAVKQATLDRVRAEIASMRTVSDLDRITPLIWRELTTLGIPFLRCGVFIMHDSLRQIHTFLSTPDGSAIAAFHLPYDAPGRTPEILSNWMNKKEYIEHWDETAFSELGDLLVQQGALSSKDVYLQTVPQGGIHLHCLPFLQGMLYVGNTEKLRADDIQLIQSVADAFSTAYARYEDFNKLEAAKQQVDKALVELKQAQQQLVQSEKMASLGELTAGIAHEIQNPLNFVNNFSEVNKELLIEMEEAIQKGDYEEANAIARDISENQEKINHHGKRAESIVKGMLQHSRTSSGQKEPTDINALCDEYLRLSYHGLRAKDKSFNAKFETHFDSSLPRIEVVPQDIGRVILNLINNAFYSVSERLRQAQPGSRYEPAVTVSTKRLSPAGGGQGVEITVSDNGNGIPDSIKDKIFQPFFTTKPTGQGTGLGLSLSYDIVKAHGGELKVASKEGEGSEFIIQLCTD